MSADRYLADLNQDPFRGRCPRINRVEGVMPKPRRLGRGLDPPPARSTLRATARAGALEPDTAPVSGAAMAVQSRIDAAPLSPLGGREALHRPTCSADQLRAWLRIITDELRRHSEPR